MEEAFEIRDDCPRLSAPDKLSIFRWKVVTSGDSVEVIVDHRAALGLIVFFLTLGVLALVGGIALALWGSPDDRQKGIFTAVCLPVAFGIGAIGIWILRSRELKDLPAFRFAGTELSWPRTGKSISRDLALRWDLVHGRWVRDAAQTAKRWEDVWELQLVFLREDKEFAMTLLRDGGAGNLKAVAVEIADATGLELAHVEEPTGGFLGRNPYRNLGGPAA